DGHRRTQIYKNSNLKKPAYDLMCWWIMEAWNEIPAQMIIKSFEKCGIINNSDNSLTRVEGELEETYEEHIVVTLEDISERLNCKNKKFDPYTYVMNDGWGVHYAVNKGN